MNARFINLNFLKVKNISAFFFAMSSYYFLEKYLIFNDDDTNKKIKYTFKNSLNYTHYNKLFQNKNLILGDEIKKYVNISTPFNRKIKYIYDLSFIYPEYENYNFNKLSDFFLNIHIFIN